MVFVPITAFGLDPSLMVKNDEKSIEEREHNLLGIDRETLVIAPSSNE